MAVLNEPVRGTIPDPGFFSLSGLEQLRAYAQRRLPSTPHARLYGYRLTQVSSGSAVVHQPIVPWFETYDRFIDLTATAELSSMLAATSVTPPGTFVRPVTLSLRYLRPCTVDDASVIARSRVLHAGSHFTTVETLMEDALGRAVGHATSCLVTVTIDPAPPLLQLPDDVVEEPVYASPDPPRRVVPGSLEGSTVPLAAPFLGMEVVESSPTRAVATLATTEWFCNTRREVESGIVATHATVTAALVATNLVDSSDRADTFEITASLLAPVAPDGRTIVATSTVHSRTNDVVVLDSESVDADGRRVQVGRGTLLVRPRRSRRASRPSNRVLLTVLFTDVVGSTERAREAGDARWRELLEEHHSVTRRQIENYMGREVKTTGDGFLATFDSPSRAVQCARAIREGVARLGLEIRAGVHTGECEVAGGDVAGVAVHVASRVQAAAEPGQILVSGTVRDLVAGSGIQLVERGSHVLKGLDGEWTLLSVEG